MIFRGGSVAKGALEILEIPYFYDRWHIRGFKNDT
jgi:hypothetical protein